MNKKLLLAGIATFAVVLGTAVVAPASAYGHKVTICHYDVDNDTYTTISISQNAKQKHLDNHQYYDENNVLIGRDSEGECD
jgi:hypothetical protein